MVVGGGVGGGGERLQMGFPGLFKKYQVEFPGVD